MTITSVAATIDATGIHAPALSEILTYLQDTYRTIYGADVYLGNDSQDGQFIAALASAFNDANAAVVEAYNAYSPTTAQGNGLSSTVKLNGIMRLVPTSSTADLTITGVANTLIQNGVVADANGYTWALPASVTIPSGGSIVVTATCQTVGAIAAPIGTITNIQTPVFGWQTATNAAAAILGQPVETDAQLRVRQSQSVAVPSQSIFEGIVGAIANLSGVTRIRGYENNTGTTDTNGIPAHSIALVVEGGVIGDIQQAIVNRITPGTGTFGDITATIIDSVGSSHVVSFARPTETTITINLTIKALAGFSGSVTPLIQQSLVDFLNALEIGDDVIYSKLFVPANLDNTGYGQTFNIQSMTIAKGAGTPGTADLTMAYNEVALGSTAAITVTVV